MASSRPLPQLKSTLEDTKGLPRTNRAISLAVSYKYRKHPAAASELKMELAPPRRPMTPRGMASGAVITSAGRAHQRVVRGAAPPRTCRRPPPPPLLPPCALPLRPRVLTRRRTEGPGLHNVALAESAAVVGGRFLRSGDKTASCVFFVARADKLRALVRIRRLLNCRRPRRH